MAGLHIIALDSGYYFFIPSQELSSVMEFPEEKDKQAVWDLDLAV